MGNNITATSSATPVGASSSRQDEREERQRKKNSSKSSQLRIKLNLTIADFPRINPIACDSGATVVESRLVQGSRAWGQLPADVIVLKCIPKLGMSTKKRQKLIRETYIHRRVSSHPNIVTAHGYMEDGHGFYIAMERLHGPTLHDVIRVHRGLPEKYALKIVFQLLDALYYMHSHGFSHRDISLRNIMFTDNPSLVRDEEFQVMLIDLGDASYRPVDDDGVSRMSSEKVGTLRFSAPEVFTEHFYLPEYCDMWSIGVVLYVMLTATFPFDGRTEEEVSQRAREFHLGFEDKDWLQIRTRTKQLVQSLLVPTPYMRPSARQAKESVERILLQLRSE